MELRPHKGGFFRPFGCAWFIREFLLGHKPFGAPAVDPLKGSPQAEIFYHYKHTLIRQVAMEKATRQEEKAARRGERAIDPENIARLYEKKLEQIPYKTTGCRYHSFISYFGNLVRLGWVEFSGKTEHSEFQDHYPKAQSRRYYRITAAGTAASKEAWANPQLALYGY